MNRNMWKNPIFIILFLYAVIRITSGLFVNSGETTEVDKTAYLTEYLKNIQKSADLYKESIEISVEVAENKEPRTKEEIQEHLKEISVLKQGVIAHYSDYINLQIIAVSELIDAEKLASYALRNYGSGATESWLTMNKGALDNMDRLGKERVSIMEEMLSEMKETLSDQEIEMPTNKS